MINYTATLAAVDAALLSVSPTYLLLGQGVRQEVASAGLSYAYYFPAGAPDALAEGGEHMMWRRAAAAVLGDVDRVARQAESEAMTANGGPDVTMPDGSTVLLTPDVAMPFGMTITAPVATATCILGGMSLEAAFAGTLGNAIVASVITITNTSTSNATSVTITVGGVPTTIDTPAQTFTSSAQKLQLSLGSYTESYPLPIPPAGVLSMFTPVPRDSLLVGASRWVSAVVPGGTKNFSGATGEMTSVQSRLARALTLPGVSAGTLALCAQARTIYPPTEPYINALGAQRTGKRGNGPTLASIEQQLVDAIAAANKWLSLVAP